MATQVPQPTVENAIDQLNPPTNETEVIVGGQQATEGVGVGVFVLVGVILGDNVIVGVIVGVGVRVGV